MPKMAPSSTNGVQPLPFNSSQLGITTPCRPERADRVVEVAPEDAIGCGAASVLAVEYGY